MNTEMSSADKTIQALYFSLEQKELPEPLPNQCVPFAQSRSEIVEAIEELDEECAAMIAGTKYHLSNGDIVFGLEAAIQAIDDTTGEWFDAQAYGHLRVFSLALHRYAPEYHAKHQQTLAQEVKFWQQAIEGGNVPEERLHNYGIFARAARNAQDNTLPAILHGYISTLNLGVLEDDELTLLVPSLDASYKAYYELKNKCEEIAAPFMTGEHSFQTTTHTPTLTGIQAAAIAIDRYLLSQSSNTEYENANEYYVAARSCMLLELFERENGLCTENFGYSATRTFVLAHLRLQGIENPHIERVLQIQFRLQPEQGKRYYRDMSAFAATVNHQLAQLNVPLAPLMIVDADMNLSPGYSGSSH